MSDVADQVRVHRALGDVSRVRILDLLRRGSRDVRQLAGETGLHQNTVRSHLDVLLEAGLVRSGPAAAAGPGRPRVVYEALVDEGEPNGGRGGYRLLARILASYLSDQVPNPSAAAEAAGSAWGAYLVRPQEPFRRLGEEQAIERVVALFRELGFDPEAVREGGDQRICLHRCPFRDAALANPDVVCTVHLGLLRGALRELGAPLEALRLDPMVEPSLCIAHLRGEGEAGSADERDRPRREVVEHA